MAGQTGTVSAIMPRPMMLRWRGAVGPWPVRAFGCWCSAV